MNVSSGETGEEIREVEEAIRREREAGAATDDTKHIRVRMGIYSMRGGVGRYTVRIRLPAGIIRPDQLEAVAGLVEETAKAGGLAQAHLTTRQGLEIHGVPGEQVGDTLRRLKEAGLSTRHTGGNVVRAVVCCPLAGISPEEPFDVTAYALAVDRFFLSRPEYQSLPRKVKIAFEGCAEDHVRTAVCDIGLRAKSRGGRSGFRITVAGGLGAVPMAGMVLEEFVPAEELLSTLEAILRVYDRNGDRKNRAKARLKWLRRDWGEEKLREAILEERSRIAANEERGLGLIFPLEEPPVLTSFSDDGELPETYSEWKSRNLRPHRSPDHTAVMVRCPLGDLSPSQLRRLARAARNFSAGHVRLTPDQNALLRWVPQKALPALYEFLSPEGLATCCAEEIMDITRCVGAEACLSAITNPASAARLLGQIFSNGLRKEPALRPVRIRVSGCPNSCGHHHASEIGLFGMAKKCHGRPVPHYAILLGGSGSGERLGRRLLEVPARQAGRAVERILRLYLESPEARTVSASSGALSPAAAQAGRESFFRFVERMGIPRLRAHLEDLVRVPSPQEGPEFYRDLEAGRDFSVDAKEGECFA